MAFVCFLFYYVHLMLIWLHMSVVAEEEKNGLEDLFGKQLDLNYTGMLDVMIYKIFIFEEMTYICLDTRISFHVVLYAS